MSSDKVTLKSKVLEALNRAGPLLSPDEVANNIPGTVLVSSVSAALGDLVTSGHATRKREGKTYWYTATRKTLKKKSGGTTKKSSKKSKKSDDPLEELLIAMAAAEPEIRRLIKVRDFMATH